MKFKKELGYIALFVSLIAVVGGGIFYFGKKTAPPPAPSQTIGITPSITSAESLVTSVSAETVPPADLTHECPYEITFSSIITVNGPGEVRYKWEKSDMGNEPEESIIFDSASSREISTKWKLEGAGTNYVGWARVKITSPNELTSNQAEFSLLCQ